MRGCEAEGTTEGDRTTLPQGDRAEEQCWVVRRLRVIRAVPCVTLVLVAIATATAQAAPGDLDPTFSGGGTATQNLGTTTHSGDNASLGMALQSNGQIVVAGYSDREGDYAVARYNANGSLDTSFGTAGTATTDFGGDDFGHAVVIQADGKIVVGGRVDETGANDFGLARYNPDGSLDTSFSADGMQTTDFGGADTIYGLAMQPDGKIVAVGWSATGVRSDWALARYNPDGSLDSSFSGDGTRRTDLGADDAAFHVALQSDGKIVVCGDSISGDDNDFGLARFNANGALDKTFSGDGIRTEDLGGEDSGSDLAIQADGKIVLVGETRPIGGGPASFALARYNPDGSLDPGFSGDGTQVVTLGQGGNGYAVAIQPDGKIVAVGRGIGGFTDFAVARFLPNGSLDTTFSGDGWQLTDFPGSKVDLGSPGFDTSDSAYGVAIQGDGRIITAGITNDVNAAFSGAIPEGQNFALARYGPTGTLDSGFGTDGLVITDLRFEVPSDDLAKGSALQADGKSVIAGLSNVGVHQSRERVALARFNADGTLDPTLGSGGTVLATFGGDFEDVADVGLQSNGKILVGGSSVSGGGNRDFALLRFNPDGALDPSFSGDGRRVTDFGDSSHDEIGGIAIQPDGKIVAVGETDESGPRSWALARYRANGSLDRTFSGDGKAVTEIGGEGGRAKDVAIQPDGRLLVGGNRDEDDHADWAAARYLPDGSLDRSFSGDGKQVTGFGGFDRFAALALQPDLRIVLTGTSEPFDSQPGFGLVRYSVRGGLDQSFSGDGKLVADLSEGSDRALQIAVQADSKIVAAGGGGGDFAVARFLSDGSLDSTFSGDGIQTTDLGFFEEATGLAIQPDGNLLATGSTGIDDSFKDFDFALARYLGGALSSEPRCAGKLATIVGTPGADPIKGTSHADVIVTLGGHDRINGGGGDDYICAGAGDDTLNGLGGADLLFGGSDDLGSASGDDRLDGGIGSDLLFTGDGTNHAFGDAGHDSLIGGGASDLLDGGGGDDYFFGQGGADDLFGRAGADALVGGEGRSDKCDGGAGSDPVIGGNGCELAVGIP
jgi:uncharacterized delta-60 repeat protein